MSSLLKQSTRLKLTACFLLLACVCASCVAASALMPGGAQTYEGAGPDAGGETRAQRPQIKFFFFFFFLFFLFFVFFFFFLPETNSSLLPD